MKVGCSTSCLEELVQLAKRGKIEEREIGDILSEIVEQVANASSYHVVLKGEGYKWCKIEVRNLLVYFKEKKGERIIIHIKEK